MALFSTAASEATSHKMLLNRMNAMRLANSVCFLLFPRCVAYRNEAICHLQSNPEDVCFGHLG